MSDGGPAPGNISTETPSGRKVVHNTGFALADLVLTKLGNVVVFVLLVRLLTGSEIAAIGVAGGYLVFIGFLDVAPIRVLLRDYPRLSADRETRDALLSGLTWFFLLQVVAILLLCAILQATVIPTVRLPGMAFLFWAVTLDFVALAFQEWIKMVFFADLRQGRATMIGVTINAARLAAYLGLLIAPSLTLYSALLAGTAVAAMLAWGIAFRREYPFRLTADRRAVRSIIDSVSDYGLWDHLNRVSIDTLLMIDTVVLSWFAVYEGLDAYTVALRFTSMLFLVPNHIRRGLQLGLSYAGKGAADASAPSAAGADAGKGAAPSDGARAATGADAAATTYGVGILANTIVSVAQLLVIWLAGAWILELLFGDAATPRVFELTLIIAVGATILNLAGPLLSAANNLCSLRQMFMHVFLPAAVLGMLGYLGLGWRFGLLGVAYGNIVAYSVLAVALVSFGLRKLPLRPDYRAAFRAMFQAWGRDSRRAV